MNIKNLKRASKLIRKLDPKVFSISLYREGSEFSHKCNSIGCGVEHCTKLDKLQNIPRLLIGLWSRVFFELNAYEWNWCFSSDWVLLDNTPIGCSNRIDYLIEKGLPKDFKDVDEKFLIY